MPTVSLSGTCGHHHAPVSTGESNDPASRYDGRPAPLCADLDLDVLLFQFRDRGCRRGRLGREPGTPRQTQNLIQRTTWCWCTKTSLPMPVETLGRQGEPGVGHWVVQCRGGPTSEPQAVASHTLAGRSRGIIDLPGEKIFFGG